MSERLKKYTEGFQTSVPRFTLSIRSPDKDRLSCTQLESCQFNPQPIENDPLSKLVCNSYNESFNLRDGKYYINKEQIVQTAVSKAIETIVAFLERNMPTKNPRQTKLYKFYSRTVLRTYDMDIDFRKKIIDDVLMVYKYVAPMLDENNFGKLAAHAPFNMAHNAISLLDAAAARGKYGKR